MRSRFNIATSILVLVLAAFSIGGATMAWFTTSADLDESVFTAGTVLVSNPVITDGGGSWQAGQCSTITWSFTNTGSKGAYVRVRPNVAIQFWPGTTELSAWTEGYEFTGNWFGRYIGDPVTGEPGYQIGVYSQQNPLEVDLLVGADRIYIGFFRVWDDLNTLYISYHMTEDYLMDEIHIYVGLTAPTHTRLGQYPFKQNFDTALADFYYFETDYVYNQLNTPRQTVNISTLAPGTDLYIATHVRNFRVSDSISWHLATPCHGSWYPVEGHTDGWWYYGTVAGPTSVASGETVTVCFEFCVDEGFNGEITVSLEAEAVQASNNAIHYIWPSNPWNPG